MVLVIDVKYKGKIKRPEDFAPESVLEMLHDVQEDIESLSSSFRHKDLTEILEIVESGEYEIDNETVQMRIDLSVAKDIVEIYRKNSKRGCYSCKQLGKETIDAQDCSSGIYCKKSDPDYNPRTGVKHSGLSPKIRKHADEGCLYWEAKISPTLDVLIENAGRTNKKH